MVHVEAQEDEAMARDKGHCKIEEVGILEVGDEGAERTATTAKHRS